MICPECKDEMEEKGSRKHYCKKCDIMVIEGWLYPSKRKGITDD